MRKAWLIPAALAVLANGACDRGNDETTIISTTAPSPPNAPAHGMKTSDCNSCHAWNIVQLHDSGSPEYNSDCILCHGDMSDEKSLSASVPGIHPWMCPYVYQAAGQTEMNNDVCIYCHKSVDFLETSAGNLRKQVAASECRTCHTVAGPGRELYE